MNNSPALYNRDFYKKFNPSITEIVRKRYRKYLREISIFGRDDLQQEIWCYLLSRGKGKSEEQLLKLADTHAAHLCEKARNRYQIIEFVNFSDLSKKDIAKTGDWDELYEKPETWG